MRRRDDLTFSFEEYERRLKELRERMERRLLDAVIVSDPENLFYLTGYQTSGYSYFQALVVPLDREPFMVMRHMEESNAVERTWVEITRTYPDTGDAIQMLYTSLVEFDLQGKSIGYERNSYYFPAYQQDRMRALFPKRNVVDCFGIVEEGRLRKSPAEIELMRRSAASTEAGMKAGYDAVVAGASENEIGAEICRAMFVSGGEYPAVLPYVTSGPRTMIGHATWEGRIVEPGEHVFLEVGGCFRRYHTAMMRTVVLGELSPSMREAERLMLEALTEIGAILRPGIVVSDIERLARDVLTHNEIGATLITRAGYSIGIAFPPSWDEGYILSVKQGDPTVLEEGMTLHLIPWLWGVDGDKTCGISDTVRITETGSESFFTMDRGFVVK